MDGCWPCRAPVPHVGREVEALPLEKRWAPPTPPPPPSFHCCHAREEDGGVGGGGWYQCPCCLAAGEYSGRDWSPYQVGCDRASPADVSVAGGPKAIDPRVPDGGALNGADTVAANDAQSSGVAEQAGPAGCGEDEVEAMGLPEDWEGKWSATIVARVASCSVDKPAGGPGAVFGVANRSSTEKDVDASLVSVEARIVKSVMMMKWCLMSSDVCWYTTDKLWSMPKHGSI